MMQESKDPYNATHYDEVLILLKESATKNEDFKGHLKLDKARNRYFLKGRLLKRTNWDEYAIRFLPEKNYKSYKEAKDADKYKSSIYVSYSQIDFITLPFDAFDWKK